MKKRWYIRLEGRDIGPLSDKELKQQANAGIVLPESQLRKIGMNKWVPARRVTGLFDAGTLHEDASEQPSEPTNGDHADQRSRLPPTADQPDRTLSPFADEAELQGLIEDNPEWLGEVFVLKREMPCADGKSMDFLCADSDGTLYIVEVKLFRNSESRRRVVSQLLDYWAGLHEMHTAADICRIARRYWSERRNLPPHDDDLWKRIDGSLQEDNLHLVFVTDELRPQIRSLVGRLRKCGLRIPIDVFQIRRFQLDSGSGVEYEIVEGIEGTVPRYERPQIPDGKTRWTTPMDAEAGFHKHVSDNVLLERLVDLLHWTSREGLHAGCVAKLPRFRIIRPRVWRALASVSANGTIEFKWKRTFEDCPQIAQLYVRELVERGLISGTVDENLHRASARCERNLRELETPDITAMKEVLWTFAKE